MITILPVNNNHIGSAGHNNGRQYREYNKYGRLCINYRWCGISCFIILARYRVLIMRFSKTTMSSGNVVSGNGTSNNRIARNKELTMTKNKPRDYINKQQIPDEILDLVRFLAETWHEIDKFVYENCDADALMNYPVIQGTSNQINIINVGKQAYDRSNISTAVKWLLYPNTRSAMSENKPLDNFEKELLEEICSLNARIDAHHTTNTILRVACSLLAASTAGALFIIIYLLLWGIW